jgi:hypothetical protein
MKTSNTLRVTALSVATFAALSGAQTAHAQSIWDVLKAKAPGLASVMQAVVVNNSQAPTVVVQPQASAATQVPAAAATPAPQASPVATTAPAPAAAASTAAQPSPAAQAGNGLKKGFDLMANRRPAQDGELPKNAKANSGVVGELDAGVMSAKEVSLTLADGNVITARLQRTASDSKFNSQSWVGTIDGVEGSIFVLTKARGVVTGFVNFKDQVLEIAPRFGGMHVLYAVEQADLSKGEPLRYPQGRKTTSHDTLSTTTGYGIGTSSADAAANVVQDLLVVYTAAAASNYGVAGIESNIQSAVQAANQAYLNSQVGITLNLVGLTQTAITESSSLDATLSAMEADSATASLRKSLAADIVIIVAENGGYCGVANVMTSNSTSFAPYAHGAVYSGCLSNQSLAHEVGHLQGLEHDRDNAVGYSGVYPYSYGYRVCASDGTGFRDIMSYPCSGAPRVLLFSNPNVTYNGYPAGVSYESNPSRAAENARSLNATAATVAAFLGGSGSSTTPPTSPTGLAVQSAAYNSVVLGWIDNSSNETGFKVERSTDGAAFTQIATVGADVKAYSDGSVSPLSTYYYRVLAFNSVGNSSYSSTINVRTPDVPPPPPPAPKEVAAANNGDGTARVSWASGGSGVNNFEVLRETWNSRKGTWESRMTAAVVPSSVLTIVDSSGAGTFRYSVRATNAGGTSAYNGPVQVAVTSSSGTTGTKKLPPGKNR